MGIHPYGLALACMLALLCAVPCHAKVKALASRVVLGRVLNPQGMAQANAIVYLQNQKTLEVKTYITTADGTYRFGELSTDADYKLWAKAQGMQSKTRSISSFDSKTQFNFDLKLEPSKDSQSKSQ